MPIPQIFLDDPAQEALAAEAAELAEEETPQNKFSSQSPADLTVSANDDLFSDPGFAPNEVQEEQVVTTPPEVIAVLDPRRNNRLTPAYLQPDGQYQVTGYPQQKFSEQTLGEWFTKSFLVMDPKDADNLIEVHPQLNGRYRVTGEAQELTEAELKSKYDMPDAVSQTVPPSHGTDISGNEEYPAAPDMSGMRPMPYSVPYQEGVVTQLMKGLFGGGFTALKAAVALLTPQGASMPEHGPESLIPPQETITAMRMQEAREQRAMEHIIVFQEQLEICREQFDALQKNPLLCEAISHRAQGEDPRDFALEMAHRKSPAHVQLADQIKDFQVATQELARQIRKVGKACELTAATDPSQMLTGALTFLEKAQQSPEAAVMPDGEDGTAIGNKLEGMVESLQNFLRQLFRHGAEPAETEEESIAPSM